MEIKFNNGPNVHPTDPELVDNIVHFTCCADNPCGYHRTFNTETGEMKLLSEGEYGTRHEGVFIKQEIITFSASQN